MRPRLLCSLLLGLLLGARALPAASLEDEVRAADTARVLATIGGNLARLDPLLSSALTYGHADGRVQTKAEFLAAVKGARFKYESYDYDDVKITRVTDEVAIMTGKARLRAKAGEIRVEFALKFLSVWRREDGGWRLFAYQSARLADAPEAAGKK